jgi:hypothetical protein
VKRFVDQGAIFAGYVGAGMAATIVVSFLLVIAIEPITWFLSLPAGMLIGYYANSRSARLAGWGRMIANAVWAGAVTAITLAVLGLAFKAIFFYGDDGFRPAALGGQLDCTQGPACVYARYESTQPDVLRANGVTDVGGFTALYWREQATTAGILAVVTLGGAVLGGLAYGATRPRSSREAEAAGA